MAYQFYQNHIRYKMTDKMERTTTYHHDRIQIHQINMSILFNFIVLV